MPITDTHFLEIITALIGMLGLIFGSGGGVWAYLTWRGKAKIELEFKTITEQREAVHLATETMLTANDTLKATVDFLRQRLNESNTDYLNLKKFDEMQAKDIKTLRNGEAQEMDRQLHILTIQVSDLRLILAQRTIALEHAVAKSEYIAEQMRLLVKTTPAAAKDASG